MTTVNETESHWIHWRNANLVEVQSRHLYFPFSSSSMLCSYYMNSIRPVQMDPDKFPGFYVFQESAFGNIILPGIPRSETNK
ncbi:unnamed protein product [Trichobilharzia szidati]|nr:unnamed protein product [Trichobilharzia szidati]